MFSTTTKEENDVTCDIILWKTERASFKEFREKALVNCQCHPIPPYVTLLLIHFSVYFLAFIPLYDCEKRVMNDKYVRSCTYIDIFYIAL